MFEIVYPEDREKYANDEFHSVEDCKDFISNLRGSWEEIKAFGNDLGAFLDNSTGVIVVIQEAA